MTDIDKQSINCQNTDFHGHTHYLHLDYILFPRVYTLFISTFSVYDSHTISTVNNATHIHFTDHIQSNLSTTVSHRELEKWPLLTGGCCSGTYIYTVNAFEYVAVSA